MTTRPEVETSAGMSVAAAEAMRPLRRVAIQVDEPAPERSTTALTVVAFGDPSDPRTPLAIVSSHEEEVVP